MPDGRGKVVIHAAGAVVWRPGNPGPDVALVHRPRYDDWAYPKGKRESGEHVLRTAVREVAEETGMQVVLGRPLPSSVYRTGGGMKQVDYWVAECERSSGFTPDHEIDEIAWLPAAQARERLSYDRDIELLDDFLSGPARTMPMILLRHASAGRKQAKRSGLWSGASDLARPLDNSGRTDAEALAGLLASFGSCRVISSEAERCVATVRPYAASTGVTVQIEPAFTVGSPEHSADLAVRRAAELTAEDVPTVVCAHRENLPAIMSAVCRAQAAGTPDGEPLRKGGFWVFQSADGAQVSAARYHPAD